jgi:hypothetical protein
MSTGAGLTFLSWVRTGLVSGLRAPPGASGSLLDATLPPTATLPVTIALDEGGSGTFGAKLVGPGDVIGLDARQVIRCEPASGATGFAPNYFAFVELDRPDLPWMLTPGVPAEATRADPDARRGMRPWLCLVVVPDTSLEPPTSARPLPRLTVLDTELPDLETAWLWAHAQVLTVAGDDLAGVLRGHPDRTLSRLVAPRRLEAGTTYLACVVPTFESGRRAGLGLSPAEGPLAPAWKRGSAPRTVELPVYHSWRFSTAREPWDFEELAKRIDALRFGDAGVGRLDVGRGGPGLPGPSAGDPAWEIPLEGILVGDLVVPGAWPGPGQQPIRAALAARLAGAGDELPPPTYGALQAGQGGVLEAAKAPRWLRELNLDPRYRVMAALGTRIVQRYQEALVASAWEQTAAMREANRLLRQAQLARAVNDSLDERLRAGLPQGRFLQLTAPLHRQISAGAAGATVGSVLARSAPLRSAMTVPFRRIARPRGPLARRLVNAPLAAPVARLALDAAAPGALRPTPTLKALGGTFDLGSAAPPGSNESLAALTRARVLNQVFSWEPNAPARPVNIPFGFLSDLVITTESVPDPTLSPTSTTTWIGRALDFEGVPQLGWSRSAALPPVGTYVDRGTVQGSLTVWSKWNNSLGALDDVLAWRPGPLFEQASAAVEGEAVARPEAIAIADLGETGATDLVFITLTSRYVQDQQSPGSHPFHFEYDANLVVGLDFDPGTVAVRGGWTKLLFLAGGGRSPPATPRLAAAGSRLFLLSGATLEMKDLRVNYTPPYGAYPGERTLEAKSHTVQPRLPPDYIAGDIVAADFGGITGTDLLIVYVAGRYGQLRVETRIAYDIDATGKVGRWGTPRTLPIAVSGGSIRAILGATSGGSTLLRATTTAGFREAAGRTQARQDRIGPVSAPPPPAPAVETAALATKVAQAVDPGTAIQAAVAAQLAVEAAIPTTVTDPLQPLALMPRFPYPTFELLRDAHQERLFPGASKLPDDCAAVLAVNRSALEAFLIGLNHEMSRELLWRGFPVRHGTFFERFWDGGRDDISRIEGWDAGSALGAHPAAGIAQPSLLLVVRAELLRRIPDAAVYAVPAKPGQRGGRTPDLANRKNPLFSGRLPPDLRLFAFDLLPRTVRGAGATDGWYFVFQEHPTAPRFGLDEAEAGFGTKPRTWSELEWPQVVASEEVYRALVHVDVGPGSPLAGLTRPDGGASPYTHRWGFSAADMAHITLQRPVLVAIHGSDLIDPQVAP